MKLGLRMAGAGAALLAGLVTTGSTALASTAGPGATATPAVASWDRGGDHRGDRGSDRDHRGDRGFDGDHRGDRGSDGEHRGDGCWWRDGERGDWRC